MFGTKFTCNLSIFIPNSLYMQVKIDTKEKFHVITPNEPVLSATMTDGMDTALLPFLQNDVKNVVLNLQQVEAIDAAAAAKLLQIQQNFYENNASFVSCNLQKNVNAFLAENELDDLLNTAPTESEAWDIVQMEEIERELLDTEDIEFPDTGNE
nr:STAS domain-containing protein [Niabella beijingensis]